MHRAESILNAVETTLTGLATTGANVQRDRVHPPESVPALSITQGGENPFTPPNMAFQDSVLEIEVSIYVKADDFNTQYNQIKAEVYAALMADRKLGIEYVQEIEWQGDNAPQLSGELEKKTLRGAMKFAVLFRHSLTTKEA